MSTERQTDIYRDLLARDARRDARTFRTLAARYARAKDFRSAALCREKAKRLERLALNYER